MEHVIQHHKFVMVMLIAILAKMKPIVVLNAMIINLLVMMAPVFHRAPDAIVVQIVAMVQMKLIVHAVPTNTNVALENVF
jgi:hypothetical protein